MASVLLLITLLVLFCEAKPPGLRLTLEKSCSKKGFCFEKHAMYPQKTVDNLLQITNISSVKFRTEKDGISDRFQSVDDNDCAVNKRNDLIYEIVDKNDAVRVVIQSEYLKQSIEVEECINPGRLTKPSYHFNDDTVKNFDMRCKQTTLDLTFIVLTLDWTDFETVKSKHGIPVACDCRLIQPN